MITSLLSTLAIADTWGPYQDGFVIPPRDDAPTDAVLVYAANYAPRNTAVGGGSEVSLASEYLTGVGAPPRVAFLPPEGGWGAGQSWALSVLGYTGDDTEVATFAFTTGTQPAPPPAEVAVGELAVGDWSEDTTYPWGCCEPVRTVSVAVSVQGGDAWSWVEIVGDFDLGRPSQITTQPVHEHLALEVGPGDHVLEFVQWEDERGPQPPCFDVVAVSASGVRGAPQRLCTEEDDEDDAVIPPACAFGGGAAGLLPSALVLLLLRGRTRASAR